MPAFGGIRDRLDIQIRLESAIVPIELKYLQTAFEFQGTDGEPFKLIKQAAEVVARAAFVKDIMRVEQLTSGTRGWAVMLTNNRSFWGEGFGGTSDAEFRLHDGAVLTGSRRWREGTAKSMTKGVESIPLRGTYTCRWRDYSAVGEGKNGVFRYLAIEVV